jgi:uncharacterized protein (TIGR03545 family)
MRRLTRWQYWLPGTMLVFVLLLAMQYKLGRMARSSIVRAAESVVGARVELGGARVSLVKPQVILHDLRIADRRDPSQSLLQAGSCQLSIGQGALWRNRAIVDRGEVVGLQMSLPGEAERAGSSSKERSRSSSTPAPWDTHLAALAQDWLELIETQFDRDLAGEFESVRLAEELVARWPRQSATLQERLRQLTRQAAELAADVDQAQVNPLRHAEFLDKLPDKVAALQGGFDKLAAEVEKLPDAVEADRRAIIAARRHDEQLIRAALDIGQIDPAALAAYLLQDQMAHPTGELIGWLRWVREIMPADTPPRHGEIHQLPDIRCQSLAVCGSVQVSGQPLELAGTITDLATDPGAAGRPIQVRMTTSGTLPLELAATIDRTQAAARDELYAECRNVFLPKLSLGRSDRLRLALGPSVAVARIHVLVQGESLSGEVEMVQTQMHVTPGVDGSLERVGLAESLAQSLRDVGSMSIRLRLSGTLDQPRWTLDSDLGPAVAKAMDRALRQAVEDHTQELLTRSQRRVDEQLAQLDRQITDGQSALSSQLAGSARVLHQIAQQPPERLSPEYVGRRLPTGSLLR